MKEKLQVLSSLGFCKNCFNPRRHGSAYCGDCKDDRFDIYTDDVHQFPLLKEVMKKFKIEKKDLEHTVFTYGDTIYCMNPLSYHLMRHEITHVFQQTKMGAKDWWDKYLEDTKFRLDQEVEAYRNQYQLVLGVKGREPAEEILTQIAGHLSGKLYGNLVTKKEAMKLISGNDA